MISFFAKPIWYFQRIKSWVFGVHLDGIRVMMYHKIAKNQSNFLTLNVEQFSNQLQSFVAKGYHFISAKELLSYLENGTPLPQKPLLLSFDDGYLDNLTLAYPILKAFNAKAIIFLPTYFIGKTSAWDTPNDATLMTVEQLKSMDNSLIEFGLHSHQHLNYKQITVAEMEADIHANLDFFRKNDLPFVPVFAYPFGGRPKIKAISKQMKTIFTQKGIKMAFRIGNRVNPFSIADQYEIQRFDACGKSFKNLI